MFLLSLLSRHSGTLAVLDKAVFLSGENAAHIDQALDSYGVKINLEHANSQNTGVDLADVVAAGSRLRRDTAKSMISILRKRNC